MAGGSVALTHVCDRGLGAEVALVCPLTSSWVHTGLGWDEALFQEVHQVALWSNQRAEKGRASPNRPRFWGGRAGEGMRNE